MRLTYRLPVAGLSGEALSRGALLGGLCQESIGLMPVIR